MSESFKKLGEVADIETGFPFKSSDFTEIGVPVIRMSDLTQGSVDLSGAAKVKTSALEGLKKFRLIRGDFLFGLSGSLDAYGVHDSDAEAYLNQRVGRLQALESEPSNYSYLSHVLSSDVYRSYAYRVASGIAQLNISPNQVRDLPIFYPSLPEQQKISQILDTLDTQIQKTEALIAKLEKIKEGLLHDLLTRGINQNGQLRPTPEQAPELYKKSVLGLIPREWDISTLGGSSISSVIGPFGSDLVASDYRSEGVPVVFVRDIAGAQYDRVSQVFVSPRKAQALSAHEVTAGDLLLTKMGLPPCISAVYPKREPAGIITADIVRLRLKADVAPEWAHHYVNSEAVKSQVRGITAGVTRPKVTLKDARSLRIAVPDIEEQARILSILQRSSSRLESESASLAKLRAQKSGLMDDLLTGRTRVASLLKDSI
jgi:type I restriction enzyme S subunit